jgi:hypothetical protein
VYYGPLELPEAASPDLHDCSHTIAAVLDVPAEGAEGIVVSSGGPEGGYALVITGGRAHYVANLLGRDIGVITSEQGLPSGILTVRADVNVPSPGRAVVTISVNGIQGVPGEITGANPVSYDVRGRGIRVGSGLPGLWPSYVAPAQFRGRIVEIRITLTGGERISGAAARAHVARTEQ